MAVRHSSKWSSVALLAGVVVVCLLVAETGLRLFYPQPLSGSWSYLDDENNVVNRSGGWVRHQLIDRVVDYHFNSAHQRGMEDPALDATRVLVLGDSFTFGWGLPQGQTYVALLQRNLDRLSLSPRVSC